jgi:hypothetical protein
MSFKITAESDLWESRSTFTLAERARGKYSGHVSKTIFLDFFFGIFFGNFLKTFFVKTRSGASRECAVN